MSEKIKSLSDRFLLPFSCAADMFLANSSPSNISSKLRSRRISRITIAPLLMSVGGLKFGDDHEFEIVLDCTLTVTEQAQVLGHEIGHTFHHNLTMTPPQDFASRYIPAEIENFCSAFSKSWVKKVTLEAITERLRNEAKLVMCQGLIPSCADE